MLGREAAAAAAAAVVVAAAAKAIRRFAPVPFLPSPPRSAPVRNATCTALSRRCAALSCLNLDVHLQRKRDTKRIEGEGGKESGSVSERVSE